jgi:hypothetical protein
MTMQDVLPQLVHVGAILYIVCFLFRDQIYLRLFAVLGDLVYAFFYYGTVADPFWAMIYSLISMAINIVMMILIWRDRSTTTLSDRDMQLYQSFTGMSPGDFRRLLKLGKWQTADKPALLTEAGQPVSLLHYIVSGEVDIDKAGRSIPISGKHFIGEIAYLQKMPATATVTAKPGCTFVSWSHDDLAKVTSKSDGLRQSLNGILSNDLASKVARA